VKTIYERLEALIPAIQKKSFRENKGLGNEIGFYIFDYEPEYELLVRDYVQFLKKKFKNGINGYKIKEFDLYEIMLDILEAKGYLAKNIEMEATKGSEYVFNATKKALRLTTENDLVVRYIRERVEDMMSRNFLILKEGRKRFLIKRCTERIARIVNSKEPYGEIYKLPELIDKFSKKFAELLKEEAGPIRQVVESDKKKVLDELSSYTFKDKYSEKFKKGFDDLIERLDRANNFYEVIAMREESDRLKLRYLDEIAKEVEKQKFFPGESIVAESSGKVVEPSKQKKIINISIAHILRGRRTIESKADIEKLLAEIRTRLERELDENTVIRIV